MMQSKVTLNARLTETLREYYRCMVPDSFLFKAQCFSNPQIRSHCCNALEKLPGGEECSMCRHDPKRPCGYVCDISKFCLATLAYRLGIGGEDLISAIKSNLSLSYEDLTTRIFEAFSKDSTVEELPEAVIVGRDDAESLEKMSVEEESSTKSTEEDKMPEVDPGSLDMITVSEAAEIWGCSAPNIYQKIKSGKLKVYRREDAKGQWLSRVEVEVLKSAGRSRNS
jgi:hypothetical protein